MLEASEQPIKHYAVVQARECRAFRRVVPGIPSSTRGLTYKGASTGAGSD